MYSHTEYDGEYKIHYNYIYIPKLFFSTLLKFIRFNSNFLNSNILKNILIGHFEEYSYISCRASGLQLELFKEYINAGGKIDDYQFKYTFELLRVYIGSYDFSRNPSIFYGAAELLWKCDKQKLFNLLENSFILRSMFSAYQTNSFLWIHKMIKSYGPPKCDIYQIIKLFYGHLYSLHSLKSTLDFDILLDINSMLNTPVDIHWHNHIFQYKNRNLKRDTEGCIFFNVFKNFEYAACCAMACRGIKPDVDDKNLIAVYSYYKDIKFELDGLDSKIKSGLLMNLSPEQWYTYMKNEEVQQINQFSF